MEHKAGGLQAGAGGLEAGAGGLQAGAGGLQAGAGGLEAGAGGLPVLIIATLYGPSREAARRDSRVTETGGLQAGAGGLQAGAGGLQAEAGLSRLGPVSSPGWGRGPLQVGAGGLSRLAPLRAQFLNQRATGIKYNNRLINSDDVTIFRLIRGLPIRSLIAAD